MVDYYIDSMKTSTLKALLSKSEQEREKKIEAEIGRQTKTEQRENRAHWRRGSEGMKPESETQHGDLMPVLVK